MVVLKPNVVRGGRAIGLGNNLYLMKGRTHSKGGIDIGKNPKTGLEVENNEVMQVSPQGVRVFSAQPILGGISPAQYILGGANPNKVFNAQEQWKKINRVNDDGTKKAELGKKIYKKRYNVSLIDDIPEHQAPLNYDEIKRRQEFMESEFNSKAYNKNSGAKGRFQIRENALQDYIRAGGEEGDLFDSNYNEKVRDWIMKDLSKSSMIAAGNPTDSVKMAKQLAAYNWGRGNLSKFLQKQKAAGIDIYRDMSWIDSLPKETRDYVNFSLRNQDINDAKNNERYNSLIKRYGGRSRKKMFSNVTKQIKQIAKQEENRNTPLPIRGEQPITPLGYDIASYAPIVGDAIQLGEGISDIKNRNYLTGAINLGLLALPNAIQGPVKKGIQSAVRKYEIKHFPGYQLKSLMEGNPLEKQLSKDGTISVNSIKAQAGKASKVDQAVIDKVLSDESFVGKKAVDYNQFRKAIQDELITYKRTPNSAYESYGMERIGIIPRNGQETLDAQRAFLRDHPELNWSVASGYDGRFEKTIPTNYGSYIEQLVPEEEVNALFPGWRNKYAPLRNATTKTFTFSSDRIPIGNAKHYDANTLGHSRTYITNDEPDILHVMESQSDWAQSGKAVSRSEIENQIASLRQSLTMQEETLKNKGRYFVPKVRNDVKRNIDYLKEQIAEYSARLKDADQAGYLRNNYTSRQIQENLRYAAEEKLTKMRYPTRETAAKIEGYPVSEERLLGYDRGTIEYDAVKKELYEHPEYSPEHESILKKYSNFPKQYKKLFKDANVRTITDKKGNSWYEIDVPKNYLNQEWQYKYGGIHIKPSKRGTFTAAAKKHGMSVQGFASKVLANKGKYSSAMFKKARFAKSASKWKHKEFGGDMDFNYWITKDNIYKLEGRKKGQWGLQDYSNSFLLNNDTLGNIGRMKTIKDMKLGTNSFSDIEVPSFTIAGETFKPKVKDVIINNNNSGFAAQNLANGIQTAINIGGNIGSYLINRDAIRRMRGPAAPLSLRAETLPTKVSTAAQEAALRENVAKQENLLAGNLSSSRSRLNATNQIRNQGIGLYNQLQERKGEIERELITRDKLNRQGITNQNIAQVNQWRNASREFENKRIDLNSENTIQHLIQGPADAIAGERGFFDNLASNDRYRMTAFLEAIKNPDALRAMNSDEIKQLARRFGVRTSWLRSIGINI